jgi:hypothetical protein
MHNHSKGHYKIPKDGVNNPGLAFTGKVGLGPSGLWPRSRATSTYCSSSSAPSAPPSGTSVYLPSGRFTRGCKCKIYLTIFNLINYNQQMTNMGCMADYIHLDKNTSAYSSKKEQYAVLYFFIVTVYIYMEII